jgi:calcineurin-like phosphoesterase family protein
MAIYFVSDTHYYHQNVIRYCSRPFEDVEKMNWAMVRIWNEIVQPEDTVYHLGDFSLALRPVEIFTPLLNGYKILIAGNHDWVHPSNKKSRTEEKAKNTRDLYLKFGWDEIHINHEIELQSIKFNMCHLPYKNDSTDTRFEKYRLEDKGEWLICGHVHEKWLKKNRMINVGVDVWDFKPVSVEKLMRAVSDKRDFITHCRELPE